MPRARKPKPSPIAAGLEVLRRELHAMKRHCGRCQDRKKRPIGFDTTSALGDRIEQDDDGDG